MARGVVYDSLAALVDYLQQEEEDRAVPISALADVLSSEGAVGQTVRGLNELRRQAGQGMMGLGEDIEGSRSMQARGDLEEMATIPGHMLANTLQAGGYLTQFGADDWQDVKRAAGAVADYATDPETWRERPGPLGESYPGLFYDAAEAVQPYVEKPYKVAQEMGVGEVLPGAGILAKLGMAVGPMGKAADLARKGSGGELGRAEPEPDDAYQWLLDEMPEGPEKELYRKEAKAARDKDALLEKFIAETEPAPTKIAWNLGGDVERSAEAIITPSVKEPGRWQGTLIDKDGPISDINRDTYEEVVRELVRDYDLDLSKAEVRAAPKAQTLKDRAKAVGYTRPAYHGSTHDIQQFELNRANVENHMGQAHYFTTSPEDASANYGGMGPDLKSRVAAEADRMDEVPVDELLDMVDDTVKRRYTERMQVAKGEGMRDEIDSQLLMEAAKARLKGPSEGMVYDVQLRLDNPLHIDGSKKEPVFEIETVFDDAGDFVEERGNGLELIEAMHDAAADFDADAEMIVQEFMEKAGDQMFDGMKASEVDSALRGLDSIYGVYDEAGDMASSEFIRQVYENLGYDSVIMDPVEAFPHMDNVPDGTLHYIVFDKYANKIRSKRAAFDPKKLGSRDIMATVTPIAAPGLTAAYLANQEQE